MKKAYLSLITVLALAVVVYLLYPNQTQVDTMTAKRDKHEKFLDHSPYKSTKDLSKKERKALGMPPNAYNERMWELTMNPDLGYPTPFKVEATEFPLDFSKGTPGTPASAWVERGPLNVGGRTRVVFYDPNDVGSNNGDGVDYNRVFAGGVGGGLWVNENINNPAVKWTIIPGLASNLTVSAYAIDPNNTNIIYVGTGEQYTDGAAIGDGLYRSNDGGATWFKVNINVAGRGDFGNNDRLFKSGIFHINDIIARDVEGNTEVYVGVGASRYFSPNFTTSNPLNYLGAQNAGIYRSIDSGSTWTRNEEIILTFFRGGDQFPIAPNDFEISADGTLYMGSIDTPGLNAGGGKIYKSSDGKKWSLVSTITNGDRVELGVSKTDPDKFYVLSNVNGQADLFKTVDNFQNVEAINEPADADLGISDQDFTRGQAFYDLVVEVDPENDELVYVGGINIHKSSNGGNDWSQVSKWSNNGNMDELSVPFVHADIQAITFDPTDSNKGLIGTDGGVSLATNFSNPKIQERNFGYNVTQFYYGDISQTNFEDGDEFIAGSQDNGTQVFNNSTLGGLSVSIDPSGGDGSYSAIDSEDGYAILGYTSRQHFYVNFPLEGTSLFSMINNGNAYRISDDNDGDFINVGELDTRFNVFYANSRTEGGSNSITACALGADEADCQELTGGAISNGRTTAMKASPFAQDQPSLFIGFQNSRLFKIENSNSSSGRKVIDIGSDDFLGSVSDIEFGDSEMELYVTFHNYGVNNVWYSNDGGNSWSQKDGNLPDIPVKAILRNPLVPNEVIIGTETGIWATNDFDSASPTWTQTINGMTSVKVVDLDLRTADNTVLATTHGRGLFTGKFTATTAGITDMAPLSNIKVFPTQAVDFLTIKSDRAYTDVKVSIYNISGQRMSSKSLNLDNAGNRINVSSLSQGIYFLKLKGSGVDQTIKFLKQ